MRIGINIIAGHYNYDSSPAAFVRMINERIAWTRLARDLGFSFVSMGHHVLGQPPRHMLPHNMSMFARLSGEVPEMYMLPSILIAPIYNPVLLAEEVATLDGLTDGKFILCLGLGYRDHEYPPFGTTKKDRVPRTEEIVHILKLLWTQEQVDYDGRFFQVHGPGMPQRITRKPHPPIWFGTGSDAGTRRAARLGDGIYRPQFSTMPELEHQLALYRRELRNNGKSEKEGTFALGREIYLGESRTKVAEKALPGFLRTMAGYKAAGVEDSMIPKGLLYGRTPELDDLPFIMGNPGECVEQITRYRDRLGLEWLNLIFASSGIPHEQIMKTIETIGRDVIPHLG